MRNIYTNKILYIHLHSIFPQTERAAWVAFQKLKWEYQKKQRTERKRLKAQALELGLEARSSKGRQATAMSSFLKRQTQSMMHRNWQIIQVWNWISKQHT